MRQRKRARIMRQRQAYCTMFLARNASRCRLSGYTRRCVGTMRHTKRAQTPREPKRLLTTYPMTEDSITSDTVTRQATANFDVVKATVAKATKHQDFNEAICVSRILSSHLPPPHTYGGLHLSCLFRPVGCTSRALTGVDICAKHVTAFRLCSTEWCARQTACQCCAALTATS